MNKIKKKLEFVTTCICGKHKIFTKKEEKDFKKEAGKYVKRRFGDVIRKLADE